MDFINDNNKKKKQMKGTVCYSWNCQLLACGGGSSLIYHSLGLFKELQQYLANLAEQCSADNNGVELPVVIILDNLHHVGSLSDIFNGFLNCKYNKW